MHQRLPDAETDFVVVGGGVAGLTVALALSRHGSVRLLVESVLGGGCTPLAQGGIAAAVAPGDSPASHLSDTLSAGCGLSDEAAARVTTDAAPSVLRWLARTGVGFDRHPDGQLRLGREGGHHRDHIAHAGGDATGLAVSAALVAAVRAQRSVEVVEEAFLRDLLLDSEGDAITGVTYERWGSIGQLAARAVILATGGYANLYPLTTNPGQLTADGAAGALRAGAELCDLEFVQFHPTALWTGKAESQVPLVSEAVRGAGGRIIDRAGRALIDGVHPLGDLAPRDIVARTIALHLRETGDDHVLLDATHLGAAGWAAHFPTVRAHCIAHGIDPSRTPVPVAPAAHYTCGGIRTGLDGRASLPGLYAAGEAACTGLHGANRLASNSLLEAVVFARRIASDIEHRPRPLPDGVGTPPLPRPTLRAGDRPAVHTAVGAGCGILRDGRGLTEALSVLDDLPTTTDESSARADRETANLHLVARAVLLAALHRAESRGSHHCMDFPHPADTRAPVRTLVRMSSDGRFEVREDAPLAVTRRFP